jgi:hypothetical protein
VVNSLTAPWVVGILDLRSSHRGIQPTAFVSYIAPRHATKRAALVCEGSERRGSLPSLFLM